MVFWFGSPQNANCVRSLKVEARQRFTYLKKCIVSFMQILSDATSISRAVKFTEVERRMVVARGCGREEMGSCLMGMEF